MSDRVYVTPENARDLDLAVELGERAGNVCQKRRRKDDPIGRCAKGNMPMQHWCGNCLKLYAGQRIHELWALLTQERAQVRQARNAS